MYTSRSHKAAVLTPLLVLLPIYYAYDEHMIGLRNNGTISIFSDFVFAFVFILIFILILIFSEFFWTMSILIVGLSGGIIVALILAFIADRLKEEVYENIKEKILNYLDWFDRLFDKYLSWLPGE